MKSRAVFLDRDGTINPDPGYIGDPRQFELFPGVVPALRRLSEAGFKLFLVTNQSGIGRGYLTSGDLEAVHERMNSLLAAGGVNFDGIRYCPHLPGEECSCRKPNPAMVLDLAREHGIDLEKSWFIGDKASDILCGRRAGCRTVLVGNGQDEGADFTAPDLPAAAELVIREGVE